MRPPQKTKKKKRHSMTCSDTHMRSQLKFTSLHRPQSDHFFGNCICKPSDCRHFSLIQVISHSSHALHPERATSINSTVCCASPSARSPWRGHLRVKTVLHRQHSCRYAAATLDNFCTALRKIHDVALSHHPSKSANNNSQLLDYLAPPSHHHHHRLLQRFGGK
ncbi:uncharacterized protein MYCFIDRAFT_212650 [Pseudocercospora fijiensis CIRAD86]|uniref:Uncharacterized protein n=1 Tax=Pseudocercospora fijiensis (strain CIRAD86) TaxID=383855 RepID=M3A1B0_PSEFD|nr:uncharacterized protein MYCFIDRAFT_212650 [Pseudocercospora fijiensis CIRAD86]EME78171.1 hypothetical protein MYCFIDRAFT_212650 [Pseudocercospora fijiensis CIRAD86]